jgi:hypothetical protein
MSLSIPQLLSKFNESSDIKQPDDFLDEYLFSFLSLFHSLIIQIIEDPVLIVWVEITKWIRSNLSAVGWRKEIPFHRKRSNSYWQRPLTSQTISWCEWGAIDSWASLRRGPSSTKTQTGLPSALLWLKAVPSKGDNSDRQIQWIRSNSRILMKNSSRRK